MKKGIDVSTYQNLIEWSVVRDAGIDFAMIKATQGRSERSRDIRLFEDSKLQSNISGANANNIRCGVYHYLTALSVKEAVEEAEYYISVIRRYGSFVSLWAAVDVESKYLPKDKKLLTSIVQAFCDRVAKAGYKPMVYTNPDFLKNRLNNNIRKYPLWLALWRNKELVPTEQKYKNLCMWQWGMDKVPGITGGVDANFLIKDIEEEKAMEKKVDNTASPWARDAVEWALKKGILQGNTEGDLMLHKEVTREEMCVFLNRLYKEIMRHYA